MNKKIFRGIRTDNGEWVCSGNLIHFNEDDEVYIPCVNSSCTCTHDENDNITEWNEVLFCKVIPETVGQYSGVIDKNKVPMYEGDIVAGLLCHEIPINAVVRFQDGAFGLEWDKRFTAFTSICNVEYEVIGNIYDNPELWRE